MNRILPLFALLLVLAQARLVAQGTTVTGETAPAASPGPPIMGANPAPSLLPPPDTASGSPAPVPSTDAVPPANPPTATPIPAAPVLSSSETTAPKVRSTPMSRAEIARVQQQEIIRRQELIFRANAALAKAANEEKGEDYPDARRDYLFAAQAYGSISRSTQAYARAAEGLTRVDLVLYTDSLKTGDTARAKILIDEVILYNPNNKEAEEKEVAVTRALANPNDTSILGNPAITPGFVRQVNEVQKLFIEAEQFRRTGQWDLAEEKINRILGIDPYNISATKALELIDAEKNQYAERARLESRDERLRQVEEKWYEPITNKDATTSAQEPQATLTETTNFDLDQKLKSIFLSLDFTNATIEEATNFLSIESKRLDDAGHKGVNFIIQPEASTTAKPISLTLNNVPLGEALRYVCQLANVKFKVQDYAISIVPFTQSTDDLISRTFSVQPNFVAPPSAVSTIDSAASNFGGRPLPNTAPTPDATTTTTDPVRQALEAKGVKFPPGASAVYTPNTGQLTVVDTADQMELIEELVNAGQAPTLMVRIATKFVEINQTDLNDLTVNTAFNFFNSKTQAVNTSFTTPQFNTALPGSEGFTPNSIDALITPPNLTFNALYLRSFLNAAQINMVILALSQKKSFDLLSEPFTLTKSGEQGVLEAVRIFPYPIAFDPPELVTQTNSSSSITTTFISPPTVIATTPTDFKRRNIGVRLVVKPQVTADNKTVDLSLFPEVTDFQGFINYGSPIFVGNPDGTQSLLSTNEINQPVFNTRRINTKVLIHDGSTVVLGGLIREDIQNADDRVPVLGDIPLIGRLFQSKAIQSTKRNLIIFVTANIYRNDGELLNPPEEVNASDVLTGRATYNQAATP